MSAEASDQQRTIEETNALIRALVEQEMLGYPFWVRGRIRRLYQSDRGHQYFDLSDEGFSMPCMLPERTGGSLDFRLSKGMEVRVFGAIRCYEKEARVQIMVEKVEALQKPAALLTEEVIEHLRQKGLYPPPQRALPETITRIGLVTSKNSEAYHDFAHAYSEAHGTATLKLHAVLLEGERAVKQIAAGIAALNQRKPLVDAIVLTRGGGRREDLAIFDRLEIVEAICASQIPVVTGIGHQRDSTLADQVADYSAITPTDAGRYLAEIGQSAAQAATPPAARTAIPAWFYPAVLCLLVVAAVIIIALLLR